MKYFSRHLRYQWYVSGVNDTRHFGLSHLYAASRSACGRAYGSDHQWSGLNSSELAQTSFGLRTPCPYSIIASYKLGILLGLLGKAGVPLPQKMSAPRHF